MSQIQRSAGSSPGVVTSVVGTNGVTANPSTGAVAVSGVNATTTTVGVASFNVLQFTVTTGAVSLLGGRPIQTITGNSGGAVPGTLGNVNLTGSGNLNVAGTIGTSSLVISESQAQVATNYTLVTTAMSPYTVLSTDYYISIDSRLGPVSIVFPNTTTTSRLFVVKDRYGQALIPGKGISLTTTGGAVLIDGETVYDFVEDYEASDILWNGTSYEVF